MLSDKELERYQRHIVLREVGGEGQMRFRDSRVAVIGAGGLGAPLLFYLAAAGVGHLTIIDDDLVSLSNLQRQMIYTTADVGAPKVDAAAARLAALNPHIHVATHQLRLDAENAADMLRGHDVITDGSDSFATRTVVNRTAVRLGTPLVSGALGSFEGQLGVFAGHEHDLACWACFAGQPVDVAGQSCAEIGILGAVAGLVGTAQAIEVLRLLYPFGADRKGQLLLIDALSMATRSVRVPKDPGCPVCAGDA